MRIYKRVHVCVRVCVYVCVLCVEAVDTIIVAGKVAPVAQVSRVCERIQTSGDTRAQNVTPARARARAHRRVLEEIELSRLTDSDRV